MKLTNLNSHPWFIIQKIKEQTKKDWKSSMLSRFADNSDWLKTLTYTYNPKYVFGIRKFPWTIMEIERKTDSHKKRNMTKLWNMLTEFIVGKLKPTEKKQKIVDFLNESTINTNLLLFWIIKGDLKCGVDKKTIIKHYGNIIGIPPYLGAVSYKPERIRNILDTDGEAYVQNKADGMYGATVIRAERAYIESRNGLILYGMGSITNELKQLLPHLKEFVVMGEIMLRGVDRHKANGIVKSIKSIEKKRKIGDNITKEVEKFKVKHSMTLEEAKDRLYMQLWDMVTFEEYENRKSDSPYWERLSSLRVFLRKLNLEKVEVIETKILTTIDQIMQYFTEQLENGLEGLIVKSPNGIWEDKKPVWQVKMKLEFISDLEIVSVNEGEANTRLEGTMGSLTCVSKHSKLVTDVSGFSDHERFMIFQKPQDYIGKIIEVKCNGLSKAEGSDLYSMLYAVANKKNKNMVIRDDKPEANTIQEIQEIENSKKYGSPVKK